MFVTSAYPTDWELGHSASTSERSRNHGNRLALKQIMYKVLRVGLKFVKSDEMERFWRGK